MPRRRLFVGKIARGAAGLYNQLSPEQKAGLQRKAEVMAQEKFKEVLANNPYAQAFSNVSSAAAGKTIINTAKRLFSNKVYTGTSGITRSYFSRGKSVSAPKYSRPLTYQQSLNLTFEVNPGSQYVCGFYLTRAEVANLFTPIFSTETKDQQTCYLTSSTLELHMVNSDVAPCTVDIYNVVPRSTVTTTASTLGPAALWDTYENKVGASYVLYGRTPFMCREFCKAYRIVNVQTVDLAPGAPHIHTMILKSKTRASERELLTDTAANIYPQYGPHVMCVVKGSIAYDGSNISSGTPNLCFISYRRLTGYGVTDSSPYYTAGTFVSGITDTAKIISSIILVTVFPLSPLKTRARNDNGNTTAFN